MPSQPIEVVSSSESRLNKESCRTFVRNNCQFVTEGREPKTLRDLWLFDNDVDVLIEGGMKTAIPDFDGPAVKFAGSSTNGARFELFGATEAGFWYDKLVEPGGDDTVRPWLTRMGNRRNISSGDILIAAGPIGANNHWPSLVLVRTKYSARCYLIDSMGSTSKDDNGSCLMRLLVDTWCSKVPDREVVTIAHGVQLDSFNCGFYSAVNTVAAFAIGSRLFPRNNSDMTQYQNDGFIRKFDAAIKGLRTAMPPGLREWLFHHYKEFIGPSGETSFYVGKTKKTQLEVFTTALDTATGILPSNKGAPRAATSAQSYDSEHGRWRNEDGGDAAFSDPVKGERKYKAARTIGIKSASASGKRIGTLSNPFKLLAEDDDGTDEEDHMSIKKEIIPAVTSLSTPIEVALIKDEAGTGDSDPDYEHGVNVNETMPGSHADTGELSGDATDSDEDPENELILDFDELDKEDIDTEAVPLTSAEKNTEDIKSCYQEESQRAFEQLYITHSFPPELVATKEIPLTTLEYEIMVKCQTNEAFTLEKYKAAMLEAMPLSGLEGKDASKPSQNDMKRIQAAQKRLERRYRKLGKQYTITKDGIFENIAVLNVGKRRRNVVDKDIKSAMPVANPSEIFYEAFKAHVDAAHMASASEGGRRHWRWWCRGDRFGTKERAA